MKTDDDLLMEDITKRITPDNWGDPKETNVHDVLIALFLLALYPLCFVSGILVAHFFHW